MAMDMEELVIRSAIYASLTDSMVASVISELSPKDDHSKILKVKLPIMQEAQVAAVSSGLAAASNLQLLHRDALLQNLGFQPQVLSIVRTAPFKGSHVLGPEPKELQLHVRSIRQAHRMAGSSVTFLRLRTQFQPGPARRHPQARRASSPGPQVSTAWGLLPNQHQSRRLSPKTLSPSVQAPAGDPGAVHSSLSEGRPKERPLLQWQANVDGLQVGARRAGFAHQWQSLLRTCRATSTVQKGVGLTFVYRPRLTHQSMTFRTRNSCEDL